MELYDEEPYMLNTTPWIQYAPAWVTSTADGKKCILTYCLVAGDMTALPDYQHKTAPSLAVFKIG